MEDEVDYSFLTQVEYEEALIDEHISEGAVYQDDGQGGYNLRSRLVSPFKKNVVPVTQPAAPAKKAPILPKKMAIISKPLQKLAHSSNPDHVQLKAPVHEVRFPNRLHYSFNLESEIQKLKIPLTLIELMKNDAFKSSILNSLQPKVHIDTEFVNLQDEKPVVTLGPMIEYLKDSCPLTFLYILEYP